MAPYDWANGGSVDVFWHGEYEVTWNEMKYIYFLHNLHKFTTISGNTWKQNVRKLIFIIKNIKRAKLRRNALDE